MEVPKIFSDFRGLYAGDVQWIPAHRTYDEAVRDGLDLDDWAGNGLADGVAKRVAVLGGPPAALVAARTLERLRNEAVLRSVGTVLLQRLKARPRTKDDVAIKSCKRAAPALPRRLRPAKRARTVVVLEQAAAPQLSDLLNWRARALCTAEQARELVWHAPDPAAGLHHLLPVGPWPAAGMQQARNGRLCWVWQCGRCPSRASDSSRALELLRKPCRGGQAVVQSRQKHDFGAAGNLPSCVRCGLQCSNGRHLAAKEQLCPVPACQRDGVAWPEGEASLRLEIGKLFGFRRWCEAASHVVQEPAEPAILPHQPAVAGPPAPPGPLAPARFHLAAKLGRHWLCLNCFARPQVGVEAFRRARCNGPSPAGELPAAQLHTMRLWGHWAALQGAPRARVGELLAHFEPGTVVRRRVACGSVGFHHHWAGSVWSSPREWWGRARTSGRQPCDRSG